MLLEGCGRFLLRSEETTERFGTMVSFVPLVYVTSKISYLQIYPSAGAYAAQAEYTTL